MREKHIKHDLAIVALVRDAILSVRDKDAWSVAVQEEELGKKELHRCHDLLRDVPDDYRQADSQEDDK